MIKKYVSANRYLQDWQEDQKLGGKKDNRKSFKNYKNRYLDKMRSGSG
jgi:hypothetical protein